MKSNRADDEHLLDYVLERFDKCSIGLPYRPNLLYLEHSIGGAPASVIDEVDVLPFQVAVAGAIARVHAYRLFDRHAVRVSAPALDEYATAVGDALRTLVAKPAAAADQMFIDDKNISLYTEFESLPADRRQALLAHEVWHLIERDRGVLATHPLIMDGTARFVENRFFGWLLNSKALQPKTLELWRYDGAAYVVQESLANVRGQYPSIYHAMLDPVWRTQTQDVLIDQTADALERILPQCTGTERQLLLVCSDRIGLPVLKMITAEGIISRYRALGGVRLADELQGQDLSGVVVEAQQQLDEFWRHQP
jgi:hypothetical protein